MKRLALAFVIALLALPGALAENSRVEFEASGSSPPFGYHFAEGVTWGMDEYNDIGQQEGYHFSGRNSDYDYLATGVQPGRHYRVGFTVEASVDGYSAGMNTAFSLTEGVPSADNKGNGKTSGAFSESVKLVMVEDGDDWRMNLKQVIAGQTTEVSETVMFPGKAQPQEFLFEVDLDEGTAIVKSSVGTVLATLNVTASETDQIYSQWFVGIGYTVAMADFIIHATPGSTRIVDLTDKAPTMEAPLFTPNTAPSANQPVATSIDVADDYAVAEVVMLHNVNGGPYSETVLTGSGGTYEGVVPGYENGTVVRVFFRATDDAGQSAESDIASWEVGSNQPIAVTENTGTPSGGSGDTSGDSTPQALTILYATLIALAGSGIAILAIHFTGYKALGGVIIAASIVAAIAYFLNATTDVLAGFAQIHPVVYVVAGLVVAVVIFALRSK